MSVASVTLTGATGLIGPQLVRLLQGRGASVTVLSRDPERAAASARRGGGGALGPARRSRRPARALSGRDAVVHLAGEPVAQRWSGPAKRAIRDSRVLGTRNLVEGLRGLRDAPRRCC